MTQNNHKIHLIVVIGIVFVPLPSIQHFIWPLSWCLLADFCNHTWIPECGFDELEDNLRIFLDECDMFEYNCDHEKDYEMTNYSECFKMGKVQCPTEKPCPSNPTCPNHRYHRMGDRYMFLTPRRQGRRMMTLDHTLPVNMMKGKRRYTPERKKRQERAKRKKYLATKTKFTKPMKIVETNSESATETIILKRETVQVNGKKLVKVVKGLVWKPGKPLKIIEEIEGKGKSGDDFLE